ncbi:MAG: hypothetical protein J5950_00530 [Clostridia bacterium]|nr:hypothetical protein [Clostridia bacterium]
MGYFLDILTIILTLLAAVAIFPFVVVSMILFFEEGEYAEREGRSRNKKISVMFIVAISLLVLSVILIAFLIILSDQPILGM